jgi:hypothetical protein
MTTKIQAGTVSHGTLRTGDLIGAFASELSRHTIYTNAPLIVEANLWLDREASDMAAYYEDAGPELVNALIDALNDIAPEGMYFGAHEGDGSDFGFWHVDDDAPEYDVYPVTQPGGCGAARNPIYTYRTAKLHNGVAAIVTVIRDGEPQYNASYAVLPTRSKAYKYARHMANIGARDMDGHVCHYDKWSTDMWADLERPGGCGAAVNPVERNHAADNAAAWYAEIKDMMAALENTESDSLMDEIWSGPLSILVRDGWRTPYGVGDRAAEYEMLLSTGGPALRVYGQLGEHGEPESAALQYQDWGTPWTDWYPSHSEAFEVARVLLTYARCFSFGE